MKIIEALEHKANTGDNPIHKNLLTLATDVTNKLKPHLKKITAQHPDFDIHDADHSEEVVQNMEKLLGAKAEKLSAFELFLLYLSAYMHDAAMAVPEWENELFKLTEGIEGLEGNHYQNSLKMDTVEPLKLSKAIEIIKGKKGDLYGSFEDIKSFVFTNPKEENFIRDLAERLIDYQEFRNGYTTKLTDLKKAGDENGYISYSDFLRKLYLRSTHAKRIEHYAENLTSYFADALSGAWGTSLAKDLGIVCRSHGEDFEFVKGLSVNQGYFGEEITNLQFVSIMLRIADVLHISYDRAPESFLAESMISSPESQNHWKFKLQGVNYTITNNSQTGLIEIKFIAHCEKPKLYYFLWDYLDWVDQELINYHHFERSMEPFYSNPVFKTYQLRLVDHVNRSGIRTDTDKFEPVNNMGFVLNQRKIIELLMGVGLYKDKTLFIRELYQNALDACRCMLAIYKKQDKKAEGHIRFGIGYEKSDDSAEGKKYLYCLDNGIGMNREMISKYFLNIGNSFYNSNEFDRLNVKWGKAVKPVSQFGIGVLSCFMVGDRIEVTTRHLDEDTNTSETNHFSIDGPHERFYYQKPDELDLEKLGPHGTLIKVYFEDEEKELINNEYYENYVENFYLSIAKLFTRQFIDEQKNWNSNLFSILWKRIGHVEQGITVDIVLKEEKILKLIPWYHIITKSSLNIDRDTWKLIYEGRIEEKELVWILNGDKYEHLIVTKPTIVKYEGVEVFFDLSFPKPDFSDDMFLLSFLRSSISSSGYLVEGIKVEVRDGRFENLDFLKNFLVNFTGENRPSLSIDRKEITSISTDLSRLIEKLIDLICEKIVEELKKHVKKFGIKADSRTMFIIWEYLGERFNRIKFRVFYHLAKELETSLILNDLTARNTHPFSSYEFVKLEEIELIELDYRGLNRHSYFLVMNKCASAIELKVIGFKVLIRSESCTWQKNKQLFKQSPSEFYIRADSWLKEYKEYDIVTSLLPIVPDKLYIRLVEKMKKSSYGHNKYIKGRLLGLDIGSSFADFRNLNALSIHPDLGIYHSSLLVEKEDRENKVKKFGFKLHFSFSVLHSEKNLTEKSQFCLFIFVPPKGMNQNEKISIEKEKESDPEYYKGVFEGWSILFLGTSGDYIIAPGIVKRSQMVKKIEKEFWEKHPDDNFFFVDGTPISRPKR